MDWEAIGAIGEVGGAIAVVATLLLLYRQIRQSSEVTIAQVDMMAKDQMAYLTSIPTRTPDLARILQVALSEGSTEELTDDEKRKVF